MMKIRIIIFILFSVMSSCEKRSVDSTKLINNYCALGASTAAMQWQKRVASEISENYKCYAVGGTFWAHSSKTLIDLSDDASLISDNRVLSNQLLRLLRDKNNNNYYPELITIMCGLNDAAMLSIRPTSVGCLDQAMSINMSNITIEDWFSAEKYQSSRETVYGSVRFVLEILSKNFPKSLVLILTPQTIDYSVYTYSRIKLINRAVGEISDIYSVPAIDLFTDSGLIIADVVDLSFLHKDQIHLNNKGEEMLRDFTITKFREIISAKKSNNNLII